MLFLVSDCIYINNLIYLCFTFRSKLIKNSLVIIKINFIKKKLSIH